MLVRERGHRVQVIAPAMRIIDPTDGNQSRPRVTRLGDRRQFHVTVVRRHATAFNAAAGQVHPRILIRRKFVGQRDQIVPFAPGKALGDEVDSSVVLRTSDTSAGSAPRSAAPWRRTSCSRADQSVQPVSPFSVMSSAQAAIATLAGSESGADGRMIEVGPAPRSAWHAAGHPKNLLAKARRSSALRLKERPSVHRSSAHRHISTSTSASAGRSRRGPCPRPRAPVGS